jgi:hypothetical protein
MLFTLQPQRAHLLYPFRFFDPVRKRWIRARYVAERHVIESSYAQWGNHRTARDHIGRPRRDVQSVVEVATATRSAPASG